MTTLADSFVNSAQRPLQLRKRPDLHVRRHQYQGRAYWVVKDPIGLNYFRFHEEEFSILNNLDGHRSLQAIREQFQAEFAPQRISLQELQQFVGMLHRSGLLISNNSGQGRQLRRRGDKKKRKELLGKLANVLALRFRGIDPERILNRLLPSSVGCLHQQHLLELCSLVYPRYYWYSSTGRRLRPSYPHSSNFSLQRIGCGWGSRWDA